MRLLPPAADPHAQFLTLALRNVPATEGGCCQAHIPDDLAKKKNKKGDGDFALADGVSGHGIDREQMEHGVLAGTDHHLNDASAAAASASAAVEREGVDGGGAEGGGDGKGKSAAQSHRERGIPATDPLTPGLQLTYLTGPLQYKGVELTKT